MMMKKKNPGNSVSTFRSGGNYKSPTIIDETPHRKTSHTIRDQFNLLKLTHKPFTQFNPREKEQKCQSKRKSNLSRLSDYPSTGNHPLVLRV